MQQDGFGARLPEWHFLAATHHDGLSFNLPQHVTEMQLHALHSLTLRLPREGKQNRDQNNKKRLIQTCQNQAARGLVVARTDWNGDNRPLSPLYVSISPDVAQAHAGFQARIAP